MSDEKDLEPSSDCVNDRIRYVASLSGITPDLEHTRVGDAWIEIARANISDDINGKDGSKRSVTLCSKRYDLTRETTGFIDSNGNCYITNHDIHKFSINNLYGLFSLYECMNSRGVCSIECKRKIADLNGIVERTGVMPQCIDDRCYPYVSWMGDSADYDADKKYVLGALRLVKLSDVGYHVNFDFDRVIGNCVNAIEFSNYATSTDYNRPMTFGPLSLNSEEKKRMSILHSMIRKAYNNGDVPKNKLATILLDQHHMSFSAESTETKVIIQTMIWELFSQEFKSKMDDKKEEEKISHKLPRVLSGFVRNSDCDRNVFHMIQYLYNQRGILVHSVPPNKYKGEWEELNELNRIDYDSFHYAFEITRRLILKLIMTNDGLDEIVRKVDGYDYKKDPVPYPSDMGKLIIDPEMKAKCKRYGELRKMYYDYLKRKRD